MEGVKRNAYWTAATIAEVVAVTLTKIQKVLLLLQQYFKAEG